jgi:hypothetical protein
MNRTTACRHFSSKGGNGDPVKTISGFNAEFI